MRAILLVFIVFLALTIANYAYSRGPTSAPNPYGSGGSILGSVTQASALPKEREQETQYFWLRECGALVIAIGTGLLFRSKA